ncbi:hypothetical protein HY486_04040 [Candidatus Woesearchaeota archaeon]|nr:hypothetical protein [Candidatus Woesearchaeota archaeon]
MYIDSHRLNILNDVTCFAIGLYKGAMDAKAINVNTDTLIYTGAATVVLRGIIGAKAAKEHNKDPHFYSGSKGKKKSVMREGLENGAIGIPISALEIAVGYGVGWTLAKIL